jgi:hypothetical protein
MSSLAVRRVLAFVSLGVVVLVLSLRLASAAPDTAPVAAGQTSVDWRSSGDSISSVVSDGVAGTGSSATGVGMVSAGLLTAPAPPTLVSPANGGLLTTLIPVMSTNTGIPTGTMIVQMIVLATDPGFTQDLHVWYNCYVNTQYWWGYLTDNLQTSKTYYWSARLANSTGNCPPDNPEWSAWTPTWSFQTPSGGVYLSAPVLDFPPNNGTLPDTAAFVGWLPVTGQLGYAVHFRDVANPNTTYATSSWTSAATSAQLWGLQVGRTYEWWVNVRNDVAWGASSEHRRFTTSAGPTATPTITSTPTKTMTPTITPSPTLSRTATATRTPTFRPTLRPGVGYRSYLPVVLMSFGP